MHVNEHFCPIKDEDMKVLTCVECSENNVVEFYSI